MSHQVGRKARLKAALHSKLHVKRNRGESECWRCSSAGCERVQALAGGPRAVAPRLLPCSSFEEFTGFHSFSGARLAYVSIRQHTSAHVNIRQHTSAYVSIREHTSAHGSIRQHTSAYVSIRQHTSAYVSIRQHTSAYVSIRQHTSAYGTIYSQNIRADLWVVCVMCSCG